MSVQNGRAFNEWLKTQLKAKKMSQRQLAQQSGVDHSTISRLVRGDRTPSLGTATKLARGLRELRDESETPHYFGLVASTTSHPTARVEYALRSDDLLSEPQVRQVMEYYLALRMRRLAANRQPGMPASTGLGPRPGRHAGRGAAAAQPQLVVHLAGRQAARALRVLAPLAATPRGRVRSVRRRPGRESACAPWSCPTSRRRCCPAR